VAAHIVVPSPSSIPSSPQGTSHSVYEIITSRIVAELERGIVPWRRPWSAKLPANLCTQKAYRGLNVLTLGSQGFASRFWLTMNQANSLGGRIRRGERSSPVIYWNVGEEREHVTRDGETRVSKPVILRYSSRSPLCRRHASTVQSRNARRLSPGCRTGPASSSRIAHGTPQYGTS
jgi:N-terminal domain of anti-restriction factor ArdC